MCFGPFFPCTIKALVRMEHGASEAKMQSFVTSHSLSFDENENNRDEHLWCRYFINPSEERSWGWLGRIMKSKARLATVLTWCHLHKLGHAGHETDSAPDSAHWGISVKGYFVVVLGIKKKMMWYTAVLVCMWFTSSHRPSRLLSHLHTQTYSPASSNPISLLITWPAVT